MIRLKNKKTTIRLAIIISIAVVGLALFLVTLAVRSSDRPASATATTVQEKKTSKKPAKVDDTIYGIPIRLVIPKIGVDTNVEQMGLTKSGDMEAPATDEASGWYKYGPHPGNVGSAVIAGHLGATGRAVFGQLDTLKKGDTISVTDDRNQTSTFVVTKTQLYDDEAAPTEVFTSTSGAHLNLITCEGGWDASKSTYAQRLVVFTDRLE